MALWPTLEALITKGTSSRNVTRRMAQITYLLLTSTGNFDINFSNRQITRNSLAADHTRNTHPIANIGQMGPMTKRDSLNNPISPQNTTNGLFRPLNRIIINKHILRAGTTTPNRALNTTNANDLMVDNLLLAGFNSKGYLSSRTHELYCMNLKVRKMIYNKLADFLAVISYGQLRNIQTYSAVKCAHSHSRKSENKKSKERKPNGG